MHGRCVGAPCSRDLTRVADDLKWLCKIIDHDLKINIGPKFVLGAIHPDAFEGNVSPPTCIVANSYAAFKNSNDLKQVLKRVESFNKKQEDGDEVRSSISASIIPSHAQCRRARPLSSKRASIS